MKKLSRIIMFMVLAMLLLLPTACTITPEKSGNGLVFELDILSGTYTVVDYKPNKKDVKIETSNGPMTVSDYLKAKATEEGASIQVLGNKFFVEEVKIPSTFNGKPVAKIDVAAFREEISTNRHDYAEYLAITKKGLSANEVASAIATFDANGGDEAYYAKIEKVTIPSSVKTIGDYAFYQCEELKEVELPNSLSSLGKSAFADCKSLTTINLKGVDTAEVNQLPSSLKKINDGVFYGCRSLSEVYIPKTIKQIGKLAFASCTALDSIVVEKEDGNDFVMVGNDVDVLYGDKDGVNITFIDNYAFNSATKMEYLNVPNSVNKIGVAVFEMPEINPTDATTKSNLKGVSFSDNVKELGAGMFKNCVSLEEDKLDLSNIEKIGESIFEGCTSLTGVQLNGKIKQIPARAFYGCTGIIEVDLTKYIDMESGDELPTQVDYIGEAAFRGCSSLRSVELGDDTTSKIKDIKRYAFRDCPSLRSIYIPLTAIRIDPRVFENSGGTVVYAKKIEGKSPSGEQVVRAPGWYNGCANIIEEFVSVEKVSDGDKVVAEYVIFANDSEENYAGLARYVDFVNTTYTIPKSIVADNQSYDVEKILKASFKNCDSLESIEFAPDTVVAEMEAEAFANTTNVKSLDLSALQIKEIPDRAFAYGRSLTEIKLSDTVTTIKAEAFINCSSLESIDVSNVKTFGKAIFKDCSALESVTFGSLATFPEQIFYNASALNEIKVNNLAEITKIENEAFYGCTSLNNVNFPTSDLVNLTTIGASAFYGCTGYTSFHIGSKLTTIGDKAFAGCSNLESFTTDPGNTNYVVTADNVLYRQDTAVFEVAYFKNESDIAKDKTYSVFDVKASYYSELIYYPANSSAKNLSIDMKNTFTYGQLAEIVKNEVGDVYAWAGGKDTSSFFSLFEAGTNFITKDNEQIKIETGGRQNKITTITKKPETYNGGNNYILGKVKSNNPNSQSKIAGYAFEGAVNLETVEIYGNIILGTGVFVNCPNLKSVKVMKSDNSDSFANVEDGTEGVLYSGKYVDGEFVPTELVQFPIGYETERFEIPATIETIGVNAFAGAKRIGTLVINDGLGWAKASNIEKAFNKANIGKFEIASEAVLVLTKDDKGNLNPALERYTDQTEFEQKISNSNGKYAVDEYGILYSVSSAYTQSSKDGVTMTNYFIQYAQLIYVSSDVDLSDKTLTISDATNIASYAFTGNPTLTTIVLGRKVKMVANSFDGCDNQLTILFNGNRAEFEDDGFDSESNFLDANGYPTNMAFKNADVYYYSTSPVGADEEYVYWHYKSALDDQTGAVLTYDATVDPRAKYLDGMPVIYQDNDLEENYGYEYQLATRLEYNEAEDIYEELYYQENGAYVIQTDNFGNNMFVVDYWNKKADTDVDAGLDDGSEM